MSLSSFADAKSSDDDDDDNDVKSHSSYASSSPKRPVPSAAVLKALREQLGSHNPLSPAQASASNSVDFDEPRSHHGSLERYRLWFFTLS